MPTTERPLKAIPASTTNAEPPPRGARKPPLRNATDVAIHINAALRVLHGPPLVAGKSKKGVEQIFVETAEGLVVIHVLTTSQHFDLH